jgi:signal peptidase I
MMNEFPYILVQLTVITGVIWLVDALFFAKGRKARAAKGETMAMPWLAEQAKSFFPVFLIVLVIRSFIVQLYTVPTGSLKPTVIPGDFIVVNQFIYGIKLPVWGHQILPIDTPQRGNIAVFHWPVNTHIDFIKRVIGLPGDHISLHKGILTINGHVQKQKFVRLSTDTDGPGTPTWKVRVMQENLDGVKHEIYLCDTKANSCPGAQHLHFTNMVVPKGEYFMMGDNRVNSDDSRDWGFVPINNVVGKGEMIIMSWNHLAPWKHKIRWDRIGTLLNKKLFSWL